jgi:hypothetical protein
MAPAAIDQVAAVKASLELMIAENAEIHEYFKDLLEKVAGLEEETPETRRLKFQELVGMGAFRFNGVDIRHFTRGPQSALPPPLFLSRTRRRLKNTLSLLAEFARRKLFGQADDLHAALELLSAHIVNETNASEVRQFKGEVDALRESPLFRAYLLTKARFIRQDSELRAEADYLAARESVEEGEETFRHRAEVLDAMTHDMESGTLALEEAQARLDALSLEPAQAGAAGAGAGDAAAEAAPDSLADPAEAGLAGAVAEVQADPPAVAPAAAPAKRQAAPRPATPQPTAPGPAAPKQAEPQQAAPQPAAPQPAAPKSAAPQPAKRPAGRPAPAKRPPKPGRRA